jgi:hypothetical protein
VAASIFHIEYSHNHRNFHVKMILQPSIPDNQENLQFFENDEHVVNLFIDNDSMTLNDLEEY